MVLCQKRRPERANLRLRLATCSTDPRTERGGACPCSDRRQWQANPLKEQRGAKPCNIRVLTFTALSKCTQMKLKRTTLSKLVSLCACAAAFAYNSALYFIDFPSPRDKTKIINNVSLQSTQLAMFGKRGSVYGRISIRTRTASSFARSQVECKWA